MNENIAAGIAAAFRRRAENGGEHLHHSGCIHNMPPAEQIEMRGWTVEKWAAMVGPLPEQITPDQWETEPLDWSVEGQAHQDDTLGRRPGDL